MPEPEPTTPDADPGPEPGSPALGPEDAKLVTLARSARLRAYAPHTGRAEGAAVRDADGRTYVAATVENTEPALGVSALRAAVVAAAASGARTFEAAAVVTEQDLVDDDDLSTLREFGTGVPVFVAGPDGQVQEALRS
jgi:4-aminobutyrate aminotransferase-like enzyme